MNDQKLDGALPSRVEQLYREQDYRRCRETDRIFVCLMLLQWAGGIVAALVISPRTWIGATPYVHLHVWAAVLLGGAVTSLPVFLAVKHPGKPFTRHVIAAAQMIWSALLIHFSGGRIETHFHVFGSLAFLAFYRDWRVLVTATVVVAGDHFVRGVYWPQSVFGVFVESPYRWIEHAAWVLFEDVFLIISCRRGVRESREICQRRAMLEQTNAMISNEVEARTRELLTANAQLQEEMTERERTQQQLETLQQQHLEDARLAGMAEMSISVLHNVGNVLNSVNVSANLLKEQIRKSAIGDLAKASQLIEQNAHDLGRYITEDPRGKHLPKFLIAASQQLEEHKTAQVSELGSLSKNVDHIKEIISVQQSYARRSTANEEHSLAELLDDAIRVCAASTQRHQIDVVREIDDCRSVVDKHKFLQIVINLINNAKQAIDEQQPDDRRLTLRLERVAVDRARIQVVDTGVGISEDKMKRLFTYGFTTRKSGHGFGLHSAGLAAKELGGSLSADSDGPGMGATFTLEIPITKSPSIAPVIEEVDQPCALV